MVPEIAAVVDKYGVAGVLAGVRQIILLEADDLQEIDDPADAETVKKLDAVASAVLKVAIAYDDIAADRLPI